MNNRTDMNLKRNMNPTQIKLFRRLLDILPNIKEREIIEELIAMHVLGKNEKERSARILNRLGVDKGERFEDKVD